MGWARPADREGRSVTPSVTCATSFGSNVAEARSAARAQQASEPLRRLRGVRAEVAQVETVDDRMCDERSCHGPGQRENRTEREPDERRPARPHPPTRPRELMQDTEQQ